MPLARNIVTLGRHDGRHIDPTHYQQSPDMRQATQFAAYDLVAKGAWRAADRFVLHVPVMIHMGARVINIFDAFETWGRVFLTQRRV